MKLDCINSWRKGNKKVWIGDICVRLGRITVLEIHLNFWVKYRILVCNFGIEF